MSVAPREECSGRALLRPQSVPHSVSTSAVKSEAPRLSAQYLVLFMKLCNRTMRQQSASCPPFDRQCAVLACSQILVVCASSFFPSCLTLLLQPVIKGIDTLLCVVSVGERHPAPSKSGRKQNLSDTSTRVKQRNTTRHVAKRHNATQHDTP